MSTIGLQHAEPPEPSKDEQRREFFHRARLRLIALRDQVDIQNAWTHEQSLDADVDCYIYGLLGEVIDHIYEAEEKESDPDGIYPDRICPDVDF